MNTEEPGGRELSKISPSQKDRPARPHLSEVSKTAKLTEAESRGVTARGFEERDLGTYPFDG